MRYSFALITTSLATCLLGVAAPDACAQATFASSASGYSATGGSDSPSLGDGPEEMMILTGKITNPAGALPGAVIILASPKQMAVTNANGEFQFTVPASAGPLQAVVTYAGYADERMTLNAAVDQSTVNLANATVITVSRRQQLKTYMKTARKQIRRDLRRVRKSA